MSAVAKSKPELLAQEVQKLRDLCYRDKEEITKDKDDLTENNILLSCDKCLEQILKDLEIKHDEKDIEEKNILDKIQVKLLTFESNVLGTTSMASQGSTIEFLIEQCTHIRSRMESGMYYCNIV
jgi:hypothetical protein